MKSAPNIARRMALAIVEHAAASLPAGRAAWAEAMRHEIVFLEEDVAALRWAAGCVGASYSERINSMKSASFPPLMSVIALTVFVFGGYFLAGGQFSALTASLPTIFIIVILGTLAATTILTTVGGRGIFQSLGQALQGRRFRRADYSTLMAAIIAVLKGKAGPLTARAYSVLDHDDVARMLSDARALADCSQVSPERLDGLLRARTEALHSDQMRAVRVLKGIGQSFIWFGIIAFLLGTQTTFMSVTELPEVIGGMLAHALSAPILAVLFAAGIAYPLAQRLEAAIADDAHIYQMIRVAFVCHASGSDAELAVKTAFGSLPADFGIDERDAHETGADVHHLDG